MGADYSLNSKIREIISIYKMSDRQFAMKIGVNQSVIGSMFQKGTEPSSKVIKNTLLAFPEISADWFLRHEGEMTKREAERISRLVDTITTLQDTINNKNQTIETLLNKIKELENKLKN